MIDSSHRLQLSSSDLYRDPRFFHGIALFNKGNWYLAHDVFEVLWMESSDSEKFLLQGLLQITVGYLHLDRKNINGAMITLSAGLMNLESYKFHGLGININHLCKMTANHLVSIQETQALSDIERFSLQINPN